jgi:hypothetical protein
MIETKTGPRTAILSVIYHESEWIQTINGIAAMHGYPSFFHDRQGIGSLAHSFNEGFRAHGLARFDYVWMLTNVIPYSKETLPALINAMESDPKLAAISPTFNSDHPHCCPGFATGVRECMFVEFTCPLVRSSVFESIQLDELMPYAGHDVDWGYKVRQAGWKIAVHHGTSVGHVYIRHSESLHTSTIARKRLREHNEEPTKQLIHARYGQDRERRIKLLGCGY